MSTKQPRRMSAVTPLRVVAQGPASQTTLQMIDLLQEHLKLASEGKLRSLALVSVSQDCGTAQGLRQHRQ